MVQAMLRQLLFRRRRLFGVALAILIGAGFLTLTMLTGQVLDSAFRAAVGGEYESVDLVIDIPDGEGWQETSDALAAVPGVAVVQPQVAIWTDAQSGGRIEVVELTTLPPPGSMRDGLDLAAGRLPEHDGEVVIHRQLARDLDLQLDGTIVLQVPATDGSETTVATTFQVVGLWSGDGRFGSGFYQAFITPGAAAGWLPNAWVTSFLVELEAGAGETTVATAIASDVPGEATIATAAEAIEVELADYEDELAIQQAGISAFAILALIVAGIVVANTCAILVAQRAREIALFRCAGATSGQVRTMVIVEAVAAGLAASVVGILLAWGAANGVLALLHALEVMTVLPERVGLRPAMILLPVIAGVVVATAAAWGPARTAARIEPLQALRTAQAPGHIQARPDPVRAGISILLLAGGGIFLLGGIAMSYGGSIMGGILVGMVGGVGTFLGVLVGASIVVPTINRLVTRVTDRLPSIPARIAAANGTRNPRRSTATTIALVIGVALVSMMVVGAETLKTTLADEVDGRAPWDVQVDFDTSPGGAVASAYINDLAQLDGVDALAPMSAFDVTIDGVEDFATTARAVDPASLAAVWRDRSAIATFGDGVALIPTWLANELGVVDGDTITLDIHGSRVPFEVIETPGWDGIILPDTVVAATGVVAEPRGVIVRLDDDADAEAMLDEAYAIADAHGLVVHGTGLAGYRETLEQALDTLLYIVTALLGVAVLIAIVGVSNTLSLSVIERTGESALLRALGYTRRQLRQTLMLEGVLLAAIGTGIGLVLGTIYGWVGAFTVIGGTWSVSLGFPAGRLAIIVVVAIACGLLASVMPARRAASVDPVVALADG